jgi:hypothetical protein
VKPEVEAVAGTAARSELELDFHRDGVTRLLFFCQAEVAEPSHLSWEGDYMVPTQDLVGREGHNSHFTDKETEVSKCLLLPAWLPSDHTALESNSSSSPKGLSLSLSLSLSRFLSLSLSLSTLQTKNFFPAPSFCPVTEPTWPGLPPCRGAPGPSHGALVTLPRPTALFSKLTSSPSTEARWDFHKMRRIQYPPENKQAR